jgi:regulator of PEP synthase PpsR (kinase-PPPase family)
VKKEDTINKLEQREARRRQSIVKAMISEPQPAVQPEPVRKQKSHGVSDFITVKETRSKRFSVLIRPSVHRKAQQKCEQLGVALNDVINQLLEKFVSE